MWFYTLHTFFLVTLDVPIAYIWAHALPANLDHCQLTWSRLKSTVWVMPGFHGRYARVPSPRVFHRLQPGVYQLSAIYRLVVVNVSWWVCSGIIFHASFVFFSIFHQQVANTISGFFLVFFLIALDSICTLAALVSNKYLHVFQRYWKLHLKRSFGKIYFCATWSHLFWKSYPVNLFWCSCIYRSWNSQMWAFCQGMTHTCRES